MAVVATVDFSKGELFPIEAEFEVTQDHNGSGVVAGIISGSTFTVRDSLGNIYQSLVDQTGVRAEVDDGGLTGRVIFDLDSSTFDAGIYYGRFKYMPVSTDLIVRILQPTIKINVTAPVEIIATFNPTYLSGLVRIYSRDTDMLNPILDDDTISAMIATSGYNGSSSDLWRTLGDINYTVFISAANCLDLMARDAAKIALIEKIGAISENTKVTYDALREEADLLRTRAIQSFVPSDTTCAVTPTEFVPFSLPIVNYGLYTIPSSALDRW